MLHIVRSSVGKGVVLGRDSASRSGTGRADRRPPSIALIPSQGGEPAVTNTATNSQFFDWTSDSQTIRYCVTVYRNSTSYDRGCTGVLATNGSPAGGTLSQTENGLADGTLVSTHPLRYFWDGSSWIPYPCSGPNCSSSTLIDRNKPVLTVSAVGTATYTDNPQVPMHIEYSDALSHPWMAGGNNAAVFVCQRRDRACTNADVHNYTPARSVVNISRLAAPGSPKQNSFDCMFDFTSQPDGPVYLCASAADQSVPDPDPAADESQSIFPTHVNQFIKPSTGAGWTAGDANLADTSCGSVVLDRVPPTIGGQASDTNPVAGDPVAFSASGSDEVSGIAGPYTWDFGDNTQNKQGANVSHAYGSPGTYRVTLTSHDGAGNEGTGSVNVVVRKAGGNDGNDAVTSIKVKDSSLLARDFQPGSLPKGDQGPTGPSGATGPSGPTGPSGGVDTTILWAVVRDGNNVTPAVLARERHAVSAARIAIGYYGVKFDRDVSNCAFGVTFGASYPVVSPGSIVAGSIGANSKAGAPDTVLVTMNATGPINPIDSGFHLIVVC